MQSLMIPLILLSFSNDADYEYCVLSFPCKYENTKLEDIPKEERKSVLECRIKRHLECSTPPKENE